MQVRQEDHRLVTGRGHFVSDLTRDGLIYGYVVRSTFAHAKIIAVNDSDVRSLPGIVDILTARHLKEDGIPNLPCGVELLRPNGETAFQAQRRILADDRVRFVGEPVAFILAETQAAAIEAADQLVVEYEELPAVVHLDGAFNPVNSTEAGPRVWDEVPDNIAFLWNRGDAGKTRKQFEKAQHVTELRSHISRVTASSIEPRGSLGYVEDDGKLILHISNQSPFALRNGMANMFGISPDELRVLVGDVGGSFGMKGGIYPEDVLVLWSARRLKRPVKWIAERTEDFLADDHARDIWFNARLALDSDHRFLGLEVKCDINIGCYLSGRSIACLGNMGGISGVYVIPEVSAEIRGLFTNTHMTAPYRGAGRPEATYIIERTIDVAARELGIDAFDLRKKNLIPSEAMPYDTGFMFRYDCGKFENNMTEADHLSDRAGFASREKQSSSSGLLRGLGISNPIEVAGGPFVKPGKDHCSIKIDPDGSVEVRSGVMSTGQGLETSLAGLVSDRLQISSDRVRYVQGDTGLLPGGRGSGGSSSTAVGGSAIATAVEQVVATGRRYAAELLDAEIQDIEFDEGLFKLKDTNQSVSLSDVAQFIEKNNVDDFTEEAEFQPPAVTFPNGCHICEVEIDPETGETDIVRYTVVEDVGNILNETLVYGQIHGGVAQGIGQALGEQLVHDSTSGQLLSATYMDYMMPRAADLTTIAIATQSVPTEVNPLGAKGVGEAGTVGSLAAAMNAVCNALAPLGITDLEMPASPYRIWKAIQDAKNQGHSRAAE